MILIVKCCIVEILMDVLCTLLDFLAIIVLQFASYVILYVLDQINFQHIFNRIFLFKISKSVGI
jgi:hypothetical protein